MEYKKERIFKNTYSSKRQDQENYFDKVTDEHVHDNKALPELVENIIGSNKITIDKLFADGAYDGNDIFRCL